MIIEENLKIYEMFLRHKEQEAEKNCAHELNLAKIYAKASVNSSAFFLSGVNHRINGNVVNEQEQAISTYQTLSGSMNYTNSSTRIEQN